MPFVDDLISRLPYVFGSEVDYLKELGKTLTNKSKILMLGIGPGQMALLLHTSAEDNIPIYQVNADGLKRLFEFHAVDNSDVSSYVKHMEAVGFIPGVIWQGNTSDLYSRFYNEYFDLLIVDACHQYACVREDIINYWPKLRNGGIALFHDYVKLEDDNGVEQAINELKTDEWEEIAQVGISIVFRKVKHA